MAYPQFVVFETFQDAEGNLYPKAAIAPSPPVFRPSAAPWPPPALATAEPTPGKLSPLPIFYGPEGAAPSPLVPILPVTPAPPCACKTASALPLGLALGGAVLGTWLFGPLVAGAGVAAIALLGSKGKGA